MTTITIDRAVLEQALEVLNVMPNSLHQTAPNEWWHSRWLAESALHKALNDAPVPVGYITVWGPDKVQFTECVGAKLADLEQKVFPVYIEPPLRISPLSLDQISMIFNRVYPAQPLSQNIINLVQEVEKHHGIR
jgi:hypothetical protein